MNKQELKMAVLEIKVGPDFVKWHYYRCPHCNAWDHALVQPDTQKWVRPGVYRCDECAEQFTIGT